MERRLEVSEAGKAKIVALTSDMSKKDLGLDAFVLAQMKAEVTLIIHIAWPVNFNIPLNSFEPHIAGLYNLLQFSLSVGRPEPARLFFCSSISTAMNMSSLATVPEAPIKNFDFVSRTGYAQSKFVCEHVVLNAVRVGARSHVLRIGQVVGDTRNGVWNDKESVPIIIRSALTKKVLPDLQVNCSWLPVDTLAASIVELCDTPKRSRGSCERNESDCPIFYNLVNRHVFFWKDLLRELHASGFEFTSVSFSDWLQLLRESAAQEEEARNPAVKLIEYFEMIYGEDKRQNGPIFDSRVAQRDSATLRSAPKIIGEGLIGRFLGVWLQQWNAESFS
ncbi:MAG: hypothetical protein Q9167_003522 [Letrouitia subvulpina]